MLNNKQSQNGSVFDSAFQILDNTSSEIRSPANEKSFEIINIDTNLPENFGKVEFENSSIILVKHTNYCIVLQGVTRR